jgi:formylglycine-generating enzyme required for sulfatase activity
VCGEEEESALAALPFGIRYEYGGDLGWDIPRVRQWEKVSRGVDGRAYPWGDAQDDRAAWLMKGTKALPRTVTVARMRDLSPYGVHGLGGNVSEWVHGPSEQGNWHFLKGGNYELDSLYSNAGFFLGLEGGTNTYWAGFRVVREIRPLPVPAP